MVSNHPPPSPQVLLAAHECHNNLCWAQPMPQQITWAVALEHAGCSQKNNQGNLLLYGLSKREGPKLCSRTLGGALLLEGEKQGLLLDKAEEGTKWKQPTQNVCGFGAKTGFTVRFAWDKELQESSGADEGAVCETVKDRAQYHDVSGTDVLCEHSQSFGLFASGLPFH